MRKEVAERLLESEWLRADPRIMTESPHLPTRCFPDINASIVSDSVIVKSYIVYRTIILNAFDTVAQLIYHQIIIFLNHCIMNYQ
uniref:Uncharacterized protein n=1 Tax=Heterorhabditis bacteriophora TaxID=37862 RepID=A0A1I7XF40_HETBA